MWDVINTSFDFSNNYNSNTCNVTEHISKLNTLYTDMMSVTAQIEDICKVRENINKERINTQVY